VGLTLLLGPWGAGAAPSDPAEAPPPATAKRRVEPAGAAPGLEGRPARALEDLKPTAAEKAWLRSALARERERLAASKLQAGDSGLMVLERVFDRGTDPASALFTSFEVFRDRVRAADVAPLRIAGEGEPPVLTLPTLPETVVIELGPGTFRLADAQAQWSRLGADVASVEIRGAGMGATTLLAGHQWAFLQSHTRPTGRQLTLRDLTFDGDAAEGSLLDLRDAAAVRLDRVRVRGWQLSGHAAAIGLSGRTYLVAEACEFDGGGRLGGFGISLRGPALLWARGCLFTDIGQAAVICGGDEAKGGSVRLEACAFVNSRVLDRESDCPVEVRGGSVAFGPGGLMAQEQGDRWGRARLTACEGVEFAPGITRCVLGDLLDVLRRTRVPEPERVTRLELEGLRAGKPQRFTMETRTSGRGRGAIYTLVLDGGRVERTLRPNAGGHHAPDDAVLARAPSLLSVLEHAALASDVPLRAVEFAVARAGADEPDGLVVRAYGDAWTSWALDPATGAVLRAPCPPN
jgi:hypothetical protein